MRAPSRRPANCGGARLGGPCRQGAGPAAEAVGCRSAAAGAAVRRRRGPTAAGRRIRGLRRCRGRRVVRCSALRSWVASCDRGFRGRRWWQGDVLAAELAPCTMAPAPPAAAAAVSRHRDGAGCSGIYSAAPAGQPRWRRSWELGGSRPLAAVRVPRKSRCGGKRAPHAAPAPATAAAAAAATSPRAPPAGKGGACARGGPSGAGAFAPRQRACPRRGAQFLRSPPRDAAPESSRWPPLTAARPLPRSAGARDRLSPWW